MINTNQELLDYAIENIKEWDDDYTHLRGDSCRFPLFFTEELGWRVDCCNQWVGQNLKLDTVGCLNPTRFNPPQVITKQEWLDGKANKASKQTPFTKDMLVAGKHVVEGYDGKLWLVLDGCMIHYREEVTGWSVLEYFDNSLVSNSEYTSSINKVYTLSPVNGGFKYGDKRYLTLAWERESEEKLQLEKKIDSLKNELKQLEKELEGM